MQCRWAVCTDYTSVVNLSSIILDLMADERLSRNCTEKSLTESLKLTRLHCWTVHLTSSELSSSSDWSKILPQMCWRKDSPNRDTFCRGYLWSQPWLHLPFLKPKVWFNTLTGTFHGFTEYCIHRFTVSVMIVYGAVYDLVAHRSARA